jgi:hypothetical protein
VASLQQQQQQQQQQHAAAADAESLPTLLTTPLLLVFMTLFMNRPLSQATYTPLGGIAATR